MSLFNFVDRLCSKFLIKGGSSFFVFSPFGFAFWTFVYVVCTSVHCFVIFCV